MKKKHKIVMLPNTKSNIYIKGRPKIGSDCEHSTGQSLYVLSDEEIKEGDWFVDLKTDSVHQCNSKEHAKIVAIFNSDRSDINGKKVIATTDSSLTVKGEQEGENAWYNPLPTLSQSFIEEYVKAYNEGTPIIDVMVEYEEIDERTELGQFGGKIHQILKLNKQNEVSISLVETKMYSREEVIELINKFGSDLTDRLDPLLDGIEDIEEFSKFNKNWIKTNL